jgi:hypothetical protein
MMKAGVHTLPRRFSVLRMRQTTLVIKKPGVVVGKERFLEMHRAILANGDEAIGESLRNVVTFKRRGIASAFGPSILVTHGIPLPAKAYSRLSIAFAISS